MTSSREIVDCLIKIVVKEFHPFDYLPSPVLNGEWNGIPTKDPIVVRMISIFQLTRMGVVDVNSVSYGRITAFHCVVNV